MESLTERIKAFLAVSDGFGYGSGSGYGSGDGSGSGSGYGYGYGYGDGDGDGFGDGSGSGSGSGSGYGFGYGSGSGSGYGSGSGSGSGYGDGDDIKTFNGLAVFDVDSVQTIITAVRGDIAKGYTLGSDFTLTACFIVKQKDTFAHGATLRKAMEALRDKLFEDMPEDERIEAFKAEHQLGEEYPCRDMYEWHHRLTGSCEAGRDQFAKDHGFDVDKDKITVEGFIKLTRNAYGGDVIRHLAEAYGLEGK